jgi:hypothetical protein
MTRRLGAAVFVVASAALVATAIAASGGNGANGRQGSASQANPLRYAESDIYIETNATDGDAGMQLRLDAEDWRWFKLRDPRGRLLIDVEARGRLRSYGLTELFFEAAEPSFEESPFRVFRQRFPEGRYSFRGRTVEGRGLASSNRFTHTVPAGPRITAPADGARVDANGFIATWEPVTRPRGVDIVRYIVVVTQGNRDVSMDLPGSATSASIPGEFLTPGTVTELEVLARERSGNQTITAVEFRTQ